MGYRCVLVSERAQEYPLQAPIIFVLKGYPRLSETFIAQEILALERAGLDIRIVSLRHPTDKNVHPINSEITAPVLYLPEYLRDEPRRVLNAWRTARQLPGYKQAFRSWLRDLRRDLTVNRVRRFGQALVLATEMPGDTGHLHAHFLHTPASVCRYAAIMHSLPWTCSAHAKDIWTSPDWELSEKLDTAEWTVTCTQFGAEHLAKLAKRDDAVHLVYHGLDLSRFDTPKAARLALDGGSPETATQLLTVGRAVPKKGLDILLTALAALPDDLHWRWHHVGGGELLPDLQAQAAELGIGDRIVWHGSKPQDFVLQLYRDCDAFVLPCRVSDDGDRDGLPNVLMEASSQGLVCVSTPISGVPELVHDGETGLLVPSEDAGALSSVLASVITQPDLRERIGKAAEARVRHEFDHTSGIDRLLDLFAKPSEVSERRKAS